MMRLGLVGVRRGHIAQLLRGRSDVQFAAVCDTAFENQEAREAFQGRFDELGVRFEKLYTDYNRFLDHDLDAVLIATPPRLHAEQSIQALQSGRHVLSEVPAVMSVAEGQRLVQAAQASTGRYLFLENCCYWAFVLAWKKMVQDGRLGEVFYAEGDYVHDIKHLFTDDQGRKTWRWDFEPIRYVTHETGPLLDILNTRGVSVTAAASQQAAPETYGQANGAAALVTTATGAVIRLLVSFCNGTRAYHQYRILGTQGALETRDGEGVTKADLADIPHLSGPALLPLGINEPGLSHDKTAGGHGTADWRMLDTAVNALVRGEPGGIDVYRGLDYSLVGACAAQSIRQNGGPVEIPDPRTW